jgi:hypothetical protein
MPALDLIAWNRGHGWTEWHIVDDATTACGRRIPLVRGAWALVGATLDRLDQTCRQCREVTAARLAQAASC